MDSPLILYNISIYACLVTEVEKESQYYDSRFRRKEDQSSLLCVACVVRRGKENGHEEEREERGDFQVVLKLNLRFQRILRDNFFLGLGTKISISP